MVINCIYTDGRKADGCRDLVAPYFCCGVAEVGVDEHPGDDVVSVEGLTVYGVRSGEACIGGGVVPVSISMKN